MQRFSSSYKGNLLLLFRFSCLCFPPTLTQKLNSHTGKEKKKKKRQAGAYLEHNLSYVLLDANNSPDFFPLDETEL